jgi:hypothetical protein
MFTRSGSLSTRTSRSVALAALLVAVGTTGCSGDRVAAPVAPVVASMDKAGNWGQRGRIVSADSVRTYTRAAAEAVIAQNGVQEAFVARYDVQQWSLRYTTVDTHGDLVVASATVFIPAGADAPLAMVSFSHGTVTNRVVAPSVNVNYLPHGIANATHGCLTVIADYLGYGADAPDFHPPHIHPYLIAGVSATTSLDALRAARALAARNAVPLDGRLFIYGYSQGGQVAMALARLIQDEPRSRFRVTAAAPMSGPYDLYNSTRTLLARDTVYFPSVYATVYEMAAFEEIYAVAPSLDAVLVPPYDTVGRRLLNLGMTLPALQATLPKVARDAVSPDVREAVLNDRDAPLSRALRENDTYDWRPEMPMRLYYGTMDIDVPWQNALTAEARMQELGAPDVLAVNVGPLSHGPAQLPAFIAARKWFDSFAAPATRPDDDDADDDGSPTAAALATGTGWR